MVYKIYRANQKAQYLLSMMLRLLFPAVVAIVSSQFVFSYLYIVYFETILVWRAAINRSFRPIVLSLKRPAVDSPRSTFATYEAVFRSIPFARELFSVYLFYLSFHRRRDASVDDFAHRNRFRRSYDDCHCSATDCYLRSTMVLRWSFARG